MTQPFRIPAGGRIDRDRPVRFTFDGAAFQGFAGDTLASALLANDVHLVGRSFKYHRPRGILSAGSEEPNALVTVDRGAGRVTPNLRATQIELYEGLTARSQNRFPSLRFDLGALAEVAAPLLSAGFYYKSFMWPRSFWKRVYEPAIRRSAGLGRAPVEADPDRYLHQYVHCDVLIVGGGAAGLAAALGASATGARVILCDEQAELGGSLLSEPDVTIDGWPAPDWVREVLVTLGGSVTLLPRTTAFGWYPGNMIGLVERVTDHLAEPAAKLPRERLWQVRAGRVVLAAGAIERPLVFPGNDRPGVMLAGAARTYLHRYGVKVGRRAVIATADDSAYRVAADLYAAGVAIAGVVDQRAAPDSEAIEAVRALGIPIHAGMTIGSTEGRSRVHSVKLANGTDIIPCDTVLMSGGWTPSVHLFSQSRGQLVFDAASGTYLPSEGAIGACAGVFDLATCLRDGTAAGGSEPRSFAVAGVPVMASAGPPVAAAPNRRAFVDFQNDVTAKDLATATTEGFVSIEHVKRYTTTGMATDQGKTSNLNALTDVAALTRQGVEAVGLTTFRPPYTPVTFGAFAGPFRGKLFAPVRLPPIVAAGAVLEDVGSWKRARCFPRDGETIDAAVARECLAVRNDVGMLDASTLGKIEVAGPDAASFLSRIYTGDFASLAPGRCRYAVLLGEDGFIRDDGIVARLAVDRFHVTTTTGGAAFVLHHMEDYLQTEFTGLRVWLTSVTEQWAVIAVQGPRAPEVLAPFIPDIDLGAMPHMSVREGHIDNSAIRLFRVSFTGEAGFEVNLPSVQAQRMWDTLRERDVTPYGTDAMHILRAEKGYLIVGQETDGTVTPDDVGLGWTIGGPDFVGKRSLSLPDLKRTDRKQLVGLLPANPAVVLEEGAQVTASSTSSLGLARRSPQTPGFAAIPGASSEDDAGGNARSHEEKEVVGRAFAIGHVTSSYRSPTLGRGFALALVAGGRAQIGSKLLVPMPGGSIEVTVTEPLFHDKTGERLRVRPVPRPAAEPLLPAEVQSAPVARPSGSVRLAALAPTTRLSVRAGSSAATAIGLAIGVLLPTVPCRSVISRDRAALWLGPDEWLIVAPETASDLAVQARKAVGDHPASIVDVSHGSQTLEITGHRAAWCVNAFCALDLDVRAFPVGMCTRTLLGKAEVVLWRIAAEVFHLHVPRSFVPYVWACLEEARLEFTDAEVV
ncbi:MAG: sarcosine oxidase subunit alpha family protein [Rhodopila sp.]|nr:sarcosine oxidase subunit alpha family protein [Rhodopila sp.]